MFHTAVLAQFVLGCISPAQGVQSETPTPESVLGHRAGADFHLATYEDAIRYFDALAAASDRVEMRQVGLSTDGRPFYVALISSPGNLANVERYREISVRLADPRGLTDDEARALAREGKAIIHIDGGLHSSEVAGGQHTLLLAHDLVARADEPDIARILDEVVLLLFPTINPDGQTLVTEWYRSNLGTPFEVASMPWLYQRYVGHDNNRDAYMLNMVESRTLARFWREWEPQVIYDHHQTAPFPTRIWLPPFSEPIGKATHPLMTRTVNTIGMHMAQRLEEEGKAGATHKGNAFDAWYPGYIDYMPNLRNIATYWTETALYRYATPHFYTIRDFPQDKRDLRSESLYASPWPGGWWRLRDAVEYMETASIATLDYAARYRENLLYNRYVAGRDTVDQFRAGPPYALFVPADQRDPVAPVELLRRLAFNGIEVHRLTRAIEFEGTQHAAGTWVVLMDQPSARLAALLMETQVYPDMRDTPDGPVRQPYDVAGWTLSYQMDVRVVPAGSPVGEDIRSALERARGEAADWRDAAVDAGSFDSAPGPGYDADPFAAGIQPPAGTAPGSGTSLVLDPAQNNTFRAINRAWAAGGEVSYDPFEQSYIVSGLDGGWIDGTVAALGLQARRASEPEGADALPQPRIGVYRPWSASMDEGWTRWVLERFEFDFASMRNADFRAGALEERFDVILLCDIRSGSILNGHAKGSVPPRYEGGIGAEGVRALDEFVRSGGTLVCLNQSSRFAIDELQLPVKNVLDDTPRDEYFAGGSILAVETEQEHPVMAGMPERSKIFYDRSPAFETEDEFFGETLAWYGDAGSPLLSGYLFGEELLAGRAAALDVERGEGHVVLIGFRPQWRAQSFGTFRVLFNALLFHGEHAD